MACAWWLDKAARLCYIDYMSRKNREKRKQARHERFDRVWVAPPWGDDSAVGLPKVQRAAWQPERVWTVTLFNEGDVLDRMPVLDHSPGNAVLTAVRAWGLTPVTGIWGWAEFGSARCDGADWTAVARRADESLTTPVDGVTV